MDWLEKMKLQDCPDQSLKLVSHPKEIIHTAIICCTDNEYSNDYCMTVLKSSIFWIDSE